MRYLKNIDESVFSNIFKGNKGKGLTVEETVNVLDSLLKRVRKDDISVSSDTLWVLDIDKSDFIKDNPDISDINVYIEARYLKDENKLLDFNFIFLAKLVGDNWSIIDEKEYGESFIYTKDSSSFSIVSKSHKRILDKKEANAIASKWTADNLNKYIKSINFEKLEHLNKLVNGIYIHDMNCLSIIMHILNKSKKGYNSLLRINSLKSRIDDIIDIFLDLSDLSTDISEIVDNWVDVKKTKCENILINESKGSIICFFKFKEISFVKASENSNSLSFYNYDKNMIKINDMLAEASMRLKNNLSDIKFNMWVLMKNDTVMVTLK